MIKRLLTLNGLAIIAAVIHHSTDWVLTAMIWWSDRARQIPVPDLDQIGSFDYYLLRMIDQMVYFAVPAFLFISGFFVAIATKANQRTIDFAIVIQRIKNLLIPYLIWSLVISIFNLILGQSFSITQLIKSLITGGVVGPFYFIPLLILLYLLSPIFVPLAKNYWKPFLLGSAILAILVTLLRYDFLLDLQIPFPAWLHSKIRNSQLLANGFWFAMGIVAGFHKGGFAEWLNRNKKILIFSLIPLFVLGILEWNLIRSSINLEWLAPQLTFFDQIFTFALIMCWLAFEQLDLHQFPIINTLGKKSYGIYLMHVPVLTFAAKGIYHFTPWLLSRTFLFQTSIVVLGLVIPVLTMKIVEKSLLRPYYKYIFG